MVALKWQVTSSSLRMVNVVKCEATLSTRASAAIFLEQGQRKETLEFKPACLLTSRCGQFSCLTYIPNFFPRLVYLVLRCVLLFIFLPGLKPSSPALESQNLNHWIAKEVPKCPKIWPCCCITHHHGPLPYFFTFLSRSPCHVHLFIKCKVNRFAEHCGFSLTKPFNLSTSC